MLVYSIKIIFIQIIFSFVLIYFSKKFKLLDYPSERKLHLTPVPYTGGLILAFVYLIIVFITDYEFGFINIILSYSFLVAIGGFLDDKYKFNPGTKIIFQVFPIFLIIDQNLYLTDLGDYPIFGLLKLGSFDKIFTILCCLILINAYNYSDGTDGLISALSFLTFISFAVFSTIILNNKELFEYLMIMSVPLVVFLIFNFGLIKNTKVFLGDFGSNIIGFIISFIAIFLYTEQGIHPALIIWPLSYIIYEFLCVNILRIINNNSIFKPGRDHFHFEIKESYRMSDKNVLAVLFLINLFYVVSGYFVFDFFGPELSIFYFVFMFIVYLLIRIRVNKSK